MNKIEEAKSAERQLLTGRLHYQDFIDRLDELGVVITEDGDFRHKGKEGPVRRKNAAQHGTRHMYGARGCRCALCRKAQADYGRQRRGSAKATPEEPAAPSTPQQSQRTEEAKGYGEKGRRLSPAQMIPRGRR